MIGQLLAGRYLILEALGIGGFSETYLARDKYLPHYPLCVVKRLQLAPGSSISLETAQQLFEMEAQILDQLGQQHAQIPTLLAYCHELDQSYLVQEYIEGETLESWIAQGRRLTATAAIALLSDLLPVLDYIHSHRIIHRDIKPSNLIYRYRDGRLVLIDFGAASQVPELGGVPDDPRARLTIGTPGYMPDEQDQGRSQFNSDLYALGMLVIHLLTGTDPQQFQLDPITGELDWRRYLVDSILDPNLGAVLDRMVRISCSDRYPQAADVLTALQQLPALKSATAPKPVKQFIPGERRWLKWGIKVTVGVMLLGAIGGGYCLAHRGQAKTLLAQLSLLIHPSDVRLQKLYELPASTKVDRMLIAPNNQILVTAGADQVLQTWSLTDGSRLKAWSGSTGKVTALSMSQNSQLLASGSQDSTIHLWKVQSGKLLRTFKSNQQAVTTVAISPDGQTIVSGGQDGTLQVWKVSTGALLQTLAVPQAAVTAVVYGASPDQLISASSTTTDPPIRQIQVWDLRTGKLNRSFTGHMATIKGLQMVDSKTLVSFGNDRILMWNLNREELAMVFPKDSALPITTSLSNHQIVSVYTNGSIRAWTYRTGEPISRQIGKLSKNLDVVLSSNHRYIACLGADHHLRVWQMKMTPEQSTFF